MSKYEIMIVVDGRLSEPDARLNISNLISLFETLPNYEEKVIFKDNLAYPIKKTKVGHRFILNFDLEDVSVLAEFNRLALLNKHILRHLVINESKDRSFRAKNNLKKIRDYEIRQEKYRIWLENKPPKPVGNS
ncbi:ribosomal protein S6 [Mycoplasma haemofelis str. Langford 1]|uniref:Small ribosomal subunit protein bS6 n=2 Tax=Mycoplasma haemofelis TaxID=29501 RepID=F6FJB8_MYCHI|nr:30S ribosomal protein S6 [Mycoplasma haemofelis]AEG72337.1 30S ribosomal protein S6 [Mycoplasma haemofelis Ohio2]CBY92023.1 ribosomal protein S6 [Mycoplasma haemofelis str. Langford 1]